MSSKPVSVLVLNGVNLGRLGSREPLTYGAATHAELAAKLVAAGPELGLRVEVRQTDDEAEMIRWLHSAADAHTPVVLNPAAWSHYSIALRDAVAQRTAPLVEVHISNVHTREEFRHTSVISAVATGVIAGLGTAGYTLALRYLARALTTDEAVTDEAVTDEAATGEAAAESERGDDASGLDL